MRKILALTMASTLVLLSPAFSYNVLTPTSVEINADELLKDASTSYENINGYQVVFEREEYLEDGKTRTEVNFMRFEKPFTIFMSVTDGHSRGRQILFSEGNFKDKMIVRPPGFFFAFIPLVELDIDDPRVLEGEKRSIKSAGIGPFLDSFTTNFNETRDRGRLQILAVEEVEVKGESGTMLDVAFLDPAAEYQRETVVFSNAHNLPIEISLYKDKDTLAETYRYLNLKPNPAEDDDKFRQVSDARIYRKYQETKSK